MSIERRLCRLEDGSDDQPVYGIPEVPDGVLTMRDLREVLRQVNGVTRQKLPSELYPA